MSPSLCTYTSTRVGWVPSRKVDRTKDLCVSVLIASSNRLPSTVPNIQCSQQGGIGPSVARSLDLSPVLWKR